jgi:hypothetical protein
MDFLVYAIVCGGNCDELASVHPSKEDLDGTNPQQGKSYYDDDK